MSRILDLPNAKLIESAVANAEGTLTDTGAFLALTGNRTGRSPKDRFIVKESSTADKIAVSYTHLTLPTTEAV